MRRKLIAWFGWGARLLVLAAVAGLAPAAAAADPVPGEDVFFRWLESQAEIRTLQSDFVQERKLRTLRHPLVTRGHFKYRAPHDYLWVVGEPAQTIAVQNSADKLTVIETGEKTATVHDLNDPGQSELAHRLGFFRPGATPDRESFGKAFTLESVVGREGGFDAVLRFVDRRMRLAVLKLTLTVAQPTGQLVGLVLDFRDGSSVTLRFENTVLNAPVPDGAFEVDLTGLTVRQASP